MKKWEGEPVADWKRQDITECSNCGEGISYLVTMAAELTQ